MGELIMSVLSFKSGCFVLDMFTDASSFDLAAAVAVEEALRVTDELKQHSIDRRRLLRLDFLAALRSR